MTDPIHKEAKNPVFGDLPLSTSGPLDCALFGTALLQNPFFNKGSAFPSNERTDFRLHGLLPPNVQTLEEQVKRAYKQYQNRPDDLAKNSFLTSIRVQNEVLFYKVCGAIFL
jgi:malate dehydrogenase (oxaloacetate-decarboxylating)